MAVAERGPTARAQHLSADDVDALITRIRELLADDERVLLGITGSPGAGKSTLATVLVAALRAQGIPVAWVPMDGFHLADVELERLGRLDRKGAIDTFDAHGYLTLLRRIAADRQSVIYAPCFERTLEQPIAGAIAVEPGTRVVITEGNYLLDESEPWVDVRAALTEVWFCEVSDDVRRERLVARHVEFGKALDHARQWVNQVDEPNAARIKAARPLADLVVSA